MDYHTIETDEWEKKDRIHKLAWVYQWAAEHRERVGDVHLAYPLFFKSARKAERTEHSKNDPNWPAKLYTKAAINFIRTYGTIKHAPDAPSYINKKASDKELISEGIEKIKEYYKKIKDKRKVYSSLAISYRLLKSNLIEAGNLSEAEQFKRKERSALMHYFFHSRSYFRAVAEWLSGIGFLYFILGVALMIFFIFPFIYYKLDLITSSIEHKITYPDAILYSIESTLGISHRDLYAVGNGRILNIIEAALSWLGLGVFIWWLTRRLE